MGNKQSARVDIPEADLGEGGAESAAQRSPNGAAVYKFEDGAWSLQTAACNPEFDDEGDDNAPKWVMDVGDTVAVVSEENRLLPTGKKRVDFIAVDGVYALKFFTPEGLKNFMDKYSDALFENTHQKRATEANKQKVYGADMSGWANGEDHEEAVWDTADEPPAAQGDQGEEGTPEYDEDKFTHKEGNRGIQMEMGAMDNSFLLREGAVDVFRNRDGGLRDADVRINLKDSAGAAFMTPTKGMLANKETSMLMLSPDRCREKVFAINLETERVVSEWSCNKDGVEIPMMDICQDHKAAQLEDTATFLGLDANRICRWDTRIAGGLAQEMLSPTLGYKDGHDFARGTGFSCMATTGTGEIAVGGRDGKVRLYNDRSMKQAKTSFPGLGQPITSIDVTHDGKWVLATTDTYLLLLHTCVRDAKSGELTTGFKTKAGSKIAAPRLLQLTPEDAQRAGKAPLTKGKFTWVTEQGKQERWIAVSCGKFSVLFNFRRVKAATAPGEALMRFTEYNVIGKEAKVAESTFMHERFTGADTHLVVATEEGDVYCAGG